MAHTPGFEQLVARFRPQVQEISIDQYQTQPQWHLIDVREDHEWLNDHLPRAIHLGRGIIERDIETRFPDKSTPLLLYCGGGYRSVMAAYHLQLMGYQHVASLIGGYKAWQQQQLPLVKD
ncbi:rhodanese-like domain-containing protein [Shewanella sp. NIFS-20-20]|uniref:rhodanese-like domain-containing protein n=1 Tax=Shewanella sp. NIFS-20-20 TaxID=2853806 RepID=UPI001C481A12|nr:rhodanese-like domain-containing protein [Shewanella sp. NIFS-20-20]MBV7314989.1 sulfurtransferase [Shewanella sp. NIFS-20-20]